MTSDRTYRPAVRNYRLLARRNFGLLWAGGLISFVGDWVLFVAMPISIYQITGSALATTIMFACSVVPTMVLGSIAGVYVDRWDRRRTVIVGNVLLAVALLPLAAVHDPGSIWIVYVVVLVEATIGQFVVPSVGALLPRLVDRDELVAANSLTSAANNLSRVAGPPIGAVILGMAGIMGVALFDAVTFVAAAALVGLMTGVPNPTRLGASVEEGTRAWRKVWVEWLDGLRLVWRDRVVATLFLLVGISSIGEGVFRVLVIVYVVEILKGGTTELGVLMSAQGVGAIIGSLALVGISARVSPARLIGWTAVLFGVIDLLIFNLPGLGVPIAVVVALFFLVGIPGAMTFPTMFGVIQGRVPDVYRGRVLGALFTTASVLLLVGLAIAGTLTGPLGTLTVLNIQGLGYVLGGSAMLVFLTRRMAASSRAEPSAAPG
jgi:MFS family permease